MFYIGVDLGGTNIAAGLVSEQGQMFHKVLLPTRHERGHKEVLRDIAALCEKVLTDSGADKRQVRSIGIGCPGTCDNDNGFVVFASNIQFKNVPVRDEINGYTGLPVYLENDANCAALGESIGGAAKGCGDSITITLGTGIGGGIIIGGKIFNGSFAGGGEVGHHVICYGGRTCMCGRKGCWETYASAKALVQEAKQAAALHPESALSTLVNNDFSRMNGKTVFEAANSGDETAKRVVDQYLQYVSCGIVNLINIFQPEKIVLGGGISAQGDVILEPIKKYVAETIYGGVFKTDIVIAKMGNDAGIIGAAMLGKNAM